jgi:hypothetical protein
MHADPGVLHERKVRTYTCLITHARVGAHGNVCVQVPLRPFELNLGDTFRAQQVCAHPVMLLLHVACGWVLRLIPNLQVPHPRGATARRHH